MSKPSLEVTLRKAYLASWQGLAGYLKGRAAGLPPAEEALPAYFEESSRGMPPDDKELLKYECVVSECLAPVIRDLSAHFGHGGGGTANVFGLGKSIIYVNSGFMRARIRIPLEGQTTAGHGGSVWPTLVHRGNGRKSMFLQPDRPCHLLTELMWRLQPREQWGKGFCLGLLLSANDPLYRVLGDATSMPLVALGAEGGSASDVTDALARLDAPTLDDIVSALRPGPVGDPVAADDLWRRVLARMERYRSSVGKASEIPLERSYTLDEMRDLFGSPLLLLAQLARAGIPASNIFYIPDVTETEHLGAVDAEIRYEPSGDVERDLRRFRKFIEDVQWSISRNVIHLVTSVERNFASQGEVYRNAYFTTERKEREDDEQGAGRKDGLRELRRIVSSLGAGLTGLPLAQEVFRLVGGHLRLAGSERGLYWRGYRSYSFEVACCVAEIAEALFPVEGLASDIRSLGPEMAHLDAVVGKYPLLLWQLFHALRSEVDLFSVPRYREHFVHAFHVFIWGLIMMAAPPRLVFPEKDPLRLDPTTLRAWFLVAMWHDMAYPLQKLEELAGGAVRRLVGEMNVKRHTGLLPLRPSLGHLIQQVQHLARVFASDDMRDACDAAITYPGVTDAGPDDDGALKPHDIITAIALDRTDHGVWSAMLMAHAVQCDHDAASRTDGATGHAGAGTPSPQADRVLGRLIEEGCRRFHLPDLMAAIMPHHLPDWGVDDLAAAFWVRDEGRWRLPKTASDAGAVIDPEGNPLGYLLAIADILGQAGREAPELSGPLPSDIGIRLGSIGLKGAVGGTLEVELYYEGQAEVGDLKKYFTKANKCLGLTMTPNIEKAGSLSILAHAPSGSGTMDVHRVSLYRK